MAVDLDQVRRLINAPKRITSLDDITACLKSKSCYSLVTDGFFDGLAPLFHEVKEAGVAGDIVVAGVWRGGSSLFFQALNRHFELNRPLWLSDTFFGFLGMTPEREEDKAALEGFERVPSHQRLRRIFLQLLGERMIRDGSSGWIRRTADFFADRLMGYHFPTARDVENLFRKAGLWDRNVHVLEGPLQVTLPKCPIDALSIVHLDVDFYEPTKAALEWAYPRLSAGGYVIVDDYSSSFNCKDAVDEFRAANHIEEPLEFITTSVAYWRKS